MFSIWTVYYWFAYDTFRSKFSIAFLSDIDTTLTSVDAMFIYVSWIYPYKQIINSPVIFKTTIQTQSRAKSFKHVWISTPTFARLAEL